MHTYTSPLIYYFQWSYNKYNTLRPLHLFTVVYSVLLSPFITSYLFKTIQKIGCDSSNWKNSVLMKRCVCQNYKEDGGIVFLNTDSTVLINW